MIADTIDTAVLNVQWPRFLCKTITSKGLSPKAQMPKSPSLTPGQEMSQGAQDEDEILNVSSWGAVYDEMHPGGVNTGALIITYTIVVVPYYDCSITPKPY